MNLRDRYRRWRKPAQWYDDHPAERNERKLRKKSPWFISPAETSLNDDMPSLGPAGRTDFERDFKKPRY